MSTKQKISPCLWFDGRAEEAAKFYTSIFPNSPMPFDGKRMIFGGFEVIVEK